MPIEWDNFQDMLDSIRGEQTTKALDSVVERFVELQATADRRLGLLKEFEWEHWDTKQGDHYCLICDANKKEGHKPDCQLAKELSDG